MRRIFLTVAFAVGIAAPSAAQGLKLAFHEGLVSVDANSVPLRSILTEWGKVGGTTIVGADRISGAPLTIKLVDVSEAKALETILRSVAGYMAAPRKTGVGPSMYDRILVMATSTVPAVAATAPRPTPQAPSTAFAGTQRFVPPRQRDQADQEVEEEKDDNPPNPPVFTFPQPGQNGGGNVNPNGQPVTYTVNPQTGTPQGVVIQPNQPGRSTVPIGVPQPGMMVPAPTQTVQPGTPGQMIRPPGGN